MMKKTIAAIVVILAAVTMVFAASESSGQNDQHINELNQEDPSDNDALDTSNMISSLEAQETAQRYIEVPQASPGTPALNNNDDNYVYTVPVIENGQKVGEIDIDAQTGQNVGGAGGAPDYDFSKDR